jgi:phospholipid/cholesterol/gamma-HCH transport system substrate-binding protein
MANKNHGFWAGLIVFIALVIFFGTILGLTGKNILIGRNYRVYFEFADISGLRNQGPIALRGFQVGKVKDVTFSKESVLVAADIKKKFRIPIDSKVEITTLNFIGEKAISITPGNSEEFLKPGAMIKGVNRDIVAQTASILTAMKKRIEGGDLDHVLQRVSDTVNSMLTFVRNLNDKANKLDINSFNRRVEDVGQASRQLKDFLLSAEGETKAFVRETEGSLEKLNETLDEVSQTLEKLSSLSAEIKVSAQKVNQTDLFGNLNQTIKELQGFLADIKKNPKKYVKFSIF